jgi:hypothetical protein
MMETTIKTVPYQGWKNNLQLANGDAELTMTLDVGPRVISYRLTDGPNVFKEWADQLGKSGESDWVIRGGHRLWRGPEDEKLTYVPDNAPIAYEQLGPGRVRLIQPIEEITGIQKEIDLTLAPSGSRVHLIHRLRNATAGTIEFAPWALSVMAPGGTEIIPLPEKITHPGSLAPGEEPDQRGFLPNQSLILWPYADLADPRLHLGTHYILLKQDGAATKPTKIGFAHRMGWIGYLRDGYLFVKHVGYEEGKIYIDGGSNFETFTNGEMLEIETLGPLARIAPGEAVEHLETWQLFKDVPADLSEAAIEANIKPLIAAARK